MRVSDESGSWNDKSMVSQVLIFLFNDIRVGGMLMYVFWGGETCQA